MRIHRLSADQVLPIGLDEAWGFFSDPRNLTAITPPELGLEPVGEVPEAMYAGQLIEYRVRVAPLLRLTWLTEITQVEAPHSFIDQQRVGPYRLWHHRHVFAPVDGGVRCSDRVHYAVPGGPFAPLVHALGVRRQLDRIFTWRRQRLTERFGGFTATGRGSSPPLT